jgi:hypothetical protein
MQGEPTRQVLTLAIDVDNDGSIDYVLGAGMAFTLTGLQIDKVPRVIMGSVAIGAGQAGEGATPVTTNKGLTSVGAGSVMAARSRGSLSVMSGVVGEIPTRTASRRRRRPRSRARRPGAVLRTGRLSSATRGRRQPRGRRATRSGPATCSHGRRRSADP